MDFWIFMNLFSLIIIKLMNINYFLFCAIDKNKIKNKKTIKMEKKQYKDLKNVYLKRNF